MTCGEFHARLDAYVDGELPVAETAAADAHGADCPRCAALARRERELRRLLRHQPRETAPPELRARVVRDLRRAALRARVRPWLVAPALTAAAAALVGVLLLPTLRRPATLVGDFVDKHIAYAQLERPAELVSDDRAEIEAWFRERARLRVAVPDYSSAGIRLVGARLAEAHERQAAYLLYEKGRTLLSVFMVPVAATDMVGAGTRVSYRGHEYLTREVKGYRVVSWSDGRAVFGLVSMLDYDALLECADAARASQVVSQ
ncbi:MAG TPA: zf-HC2 domain-containing protein [Methylomirabilota bacterium]|nr:zf-HC2 domain-containing protein [Methylomirabilota bacterium]